MSECAFHSSLKLNSFSKGDILTHAEVIPKPSSKGVITLLKSWQRKKIASIMSGNISFQFIAEFGTIFLL